MRYLLIIAALLFATPAWAQPAKAESAPASIQQLADSVPKVEITQGTNNSFVVEQKEDKRTTEREAKDLAAQIKMAKYAQYLFWLTVISAILVSGQLVVTLRATTAAKDAATAAITQAESIKSAERAYVKVSHVEPGIGIPIEADTGNFPIEFEIKNWGETPADIVDVHLETLTLSAGTALPIPPQYSRRPDQPPVNAFLVRNEAFYLVPSRGHLVIEAPIGEIEDGVKDFYIIGYVDYRDKFDGRHRAGYARKYMPKAGTTQVAPETPMEKLIGYKLVRNNNLSFVFEAGYNYDEPRKEGDGHDWGAAV